jgi:hypothetical protein
MERNGEMRRGREEEFILSIYPTESNTHPIQYHLYHIITIPGDGGIQRRQVQVRSRLLPSEDR